MKLNDGKPWFRSTRLFLVKPITREGWLLLIALQAFIILTMFALWLIDVRSPWWEVVRWAFALIFFPALALIFYKRDDGF